MPYAAGTRLDSCTLPPMAPCPPHRCRAAQVPLLWSEVVGPFIAEHPELGLPGGERGYELYRWATAAVASYSFILGDDKYQVLVVGVGIPVESTRTESTRKDCVRSLCARVCVEGQHTASSEARVTETRWDEGPKVRP